MKRTLTCLVCPRGCLLTVDEHNNVTGNMCARGIPYAHQELTNPKRTLTYVIKVNGVKEPVPVRTDVPISKDLIPDVVAHLNTLEFNAPLAFNEVIVANIFGSGANIITSKKIS